MTRPWRRAAIFLDRDGTIVQEVHYLNRLEQMRLIAGAAQAIRAARDAGHPVVVVTNQSGVARGLVSADFARASAAHLESLLAGEGAGLDGYYDCPYHPDGLPPYNREHPERKPAPGMLLRASAELGLTLRGAWIVGDKRSDLETGAGHGVIPLLVRTGYGQTTEGDLPADFAERGGRVFDDLPAALGWILNPEADPTPGKKAT